MLKLMAVQLEKDRTSMACLEGLQEKVSFLYKNTAAQLRLTKLLSKGQT